MPIGVDGNKEASSMNWRQYFCPSSYCAAKSWMVQRSADNSELWSVAHTPDERPYSIAAVEPVCPQCGATLSAVQRRAETGHENTSEVGPVFDFARSLAWVDSDKEPARGLRLQLEDPYTAP
jgi:hypothetical protein